MFRGFPGVPAAATCLAMALVAASTTSPARVAAQDESPDGKIWDGAFTAAQADRGEKSFLEGPCAGCHQRDLSGDPARNGPPLKGDNFFAHYENGSVNDLFVKIRDTMPPNANAALTEEAKLDVVAFLLRANGFPAGKEELKMEQESLENIRMVRKGAAARGVPNFALVQVVGCLTQTPDNSWRLTNTSDPRSTKEETPTAAALKEAEAQALGTETFGLISVSRGFAAPSHKGHKVEARGLLYRSPTERFLNLTSLQMVSASCPN